MAWCIAGRNRPMARTKGPFSPPPAGSPTASPCKGATRAARAYLERVLALRNDVGLLSEEWDTRRRRMAGNFPQALSHLALVNTALGLCGPVLQRGG